MSKRKQTHETTHTHNQSLTFVDIHKNYIIVGFSGKIGREQHGKEDENEWWILYSIYVYGCLYTKTHTHTHHHTTNNNKLHTGNKKTKKKKGKDPGNRIGSDLKTT